MKTRVLIIDDSLTLRKFIERILEKAPVGFEFKSCVDGTQGLQVVESFAPQIILLDYMLPDYRGEEVCRQLLASPSTVSIPVVLMGSYTDEIKRTRSDCRNVADVIGKPFTPELLLATVNYVLTQQRDVVPGGGETNGGRSVTTRGAIKMRGSTGYISLTNALRTIEREKLTGVLSVSLEKFPVEVYTREGAVEMVTTRDVRMYLKDSTFDFPNSKVWEACEKGQVDSSCPLFILMSERKLMARAMVNPLVEIHGHRLFSRLWVSDKLSYEYEELESLPAFIGPHEGGHGSMDEWILKTLRYVDHSLLPTRIMADHDGTPSLRRLGYERLKTFRLNREEMDFVARVDGSSTLSAIAVDMGISFEGARQILFRFLSIDFMEYWPASLFAPAPAESPGAGSEQNGMGSDADLMEALMEAGADQTGPVVVGAEDWIAI